MGKIKTSISIEENVSSAFRSMNTIVNSTLNTFQNFDNVVNETPTISNANESILNSISNASNDVANNINNMNNMIDSVGTIDSNNISNLNGIATETSNVSSEIDRLNNNMSNSPNIDYWTDAVGNYSKSALEAIYTTEELVKQGFKTADALKAQENAVEQVNDKVDKLKDNVFTWSTMPNIEIFNSSGIERYEQEIASAQRLTEKLVQSQLEIQNQANNMNFINNTALGDLNNINNRLIRLQSYMTELEEKKITTIGADEVSPEIEKLRQKINDALQSQNQLNEAMQKMDSSKAYSTYENLDQNIRDAENEVINFNNKIDDMNNKINNVDKSSGSLFKTLMGFSVVQKVISMITGQLDSAMKRMDTMSNFKKTMTAITGSSDAANASLNELKGITKGTAYGLDVAAKATQNFTTRGLGIATATHEVGKWADAVSFYGDGSNEQLSSVTDALGKMLSKGKVEMEQLNRITDAGINAVGIYAQATGQSVGKVQKNLTDGKISAYDFITTTSNAFENGTNGVLNISGAAKNAGETWSTTIANMKAAVTRGVVNMIESINNSLTQAGFGTILTGIKSVGVNMEKVLGKIGGIVGGVITILSPIFSLIQQIGTFIYDNWSIIEPLVLGIAAALMIYYGAQMAVNTITAISTGIQAAKTLATTVHSAAVAMETGATFAATAAQYGFNAALLACPLTWIVIAIIAVIAGIYMAVAAFNKFTNSTVSATGIIMGVIYSLAAYIYNTFIVPLWNTFAALANFFANLFNDPAAAVKVLFYDLADTVLGYIETMARGIEDVINKIPKVHVDLTSGLSSFRSQLQQAAQDVKDESEWEEVVGKLEFWDYSDAASSGYAAGVAVDNKVSSMFNMKDLGANLTSGLENFETADMANNIADTANNTGKIADAMDITEEDLKYLRDLAEQEVINRFTTAEINIEMNNNNNISSENDLDGIVSGLEEKIYEMANSMAEGVHD